MSHWKLMTTSLLACSLAMSTACEDFDEAFGSDSGDKQSRASDVCTKTNGSGDCAPYEAEDNTGQSGCRKDTKHAGYTGAGFMDFGGNGTWVEWNNIAAPVASEYTLTLRYANGSAGNRQAAILVAGKQVGNVPFAQTGGWTSWKTTTFKVALKQGNNTIRILANTGSGGPNLDNMLVVGKNLVQDNCPNDPNKTQPGLCGCGVPEGSCGSGTGSCAQADEHKIATLSCPNGERIIRIDFASYGLPSGSCDAGFEQGTCHATSSESKVKAACLNKQSCAVSASNGTFGDPCSGKFKSLAVVYKCSGDGDDDDDNSDQCPNDPNKTVPGLCGCGVPEGACNDDDPDVTEGPLDKASNTKLRIASWNNFRGSIFPKTSTLWRAINTAGKYHVTRTEGAARIIEAVDADIWLMQETAYSSSGLPAGITEADIERQIASYMQSVTGDSWKARCNGRGLCTMVRGNIRFDGHWQRGTRVTGDRAVLTDNTRVLLMNSHYMNTSNAEDTKAIIEEIGSSVQAVFVGGDFNDGFGGSRYNIIDGISGMNNLSMLHWKDPNADHLTSSMQNSQHKNTKGYMKWGSGPVGQDLVTSIGGGQIDHFFLKSNTWRAGNRFILNTLLFAPETLDLYGLEPLDIALQPQFYLKYFEDFLTDGIIYEIPASAYDASAGLDHDHLPMIVDFTW